MASTTLIAVLNLGGELLYVVDQRLRAQRVPRETGIKVIADIVSVLFDDELLKELESSPGLGKHTYVKQLMEDIASVSVMRLDRVSMDKLWELTAMVFKWQLTSVGPDGLLRLTQRHLAGIVGLLPEHPAMAKVRRCSAKLENANIPGRRAELMRNCILSWLNDFHIKVSLLLRLGFQRTDGSFVLAVDPDEATSRIIQNLGDNIYLYEMSEGVDADEARDRNTDVSEVSLLARDILGDSPEKGKTAGRFRHRFLQSDKKFDGDSKAAASCEFEESAPQQRKQVIESLDVMKEAETSLRDDLLDMLFSNNP